MGEAKGAIMEALNWLVAASLACILLITCVNALTMPRLLAMGRHGRDEAATIPMAIRDLLRQTYRHFEVIVLDDDSTDGTAAAALAAAGGDPRVRVVHGDPLPGGWLGKAWACHQLGRLGRGRWLLFADADVRWQPDALAAILAHAADRRADVLAVWPTQITRTWAERLVVPLLSFAAVGYLPWPLVHALPWRSLAAANGQCMLFRREAYQAVGGHEAVRATIIEDVALARRAKASGLSLCLVDASGLVACRMYQSWREVRDGFAKNILAGYGGRVSLLLLATVRHWLLFVGPWIGLVGGFWGLRWPGWPHWPAAFRDADDPHCGPVDLLAVALWRPPMEEAARIPEGYGGPPWGVRRPRCRAVYLHWMAGAPGAIRWDSCCASSLRERTRIRQV